MMRRIVQLQILKGHSCQLMLLQPRKEVKCIFGVVVDMLILMIALWQRDMGEILLDLLCRVARSLRGGDSTHDSRNRML